MKRKIIINPDTPNAVENPKEFNELLKEYKSLSKVSGTSSSSLNFIKWAAGIAAVLTVGYFIFNSSSQEYITAEKSNTTNLIDEKLAESKTPIFELPFWEATVSSNEETTLISPDGVIIEVPENAFINTAGEVITEDVTLKLTQFDDALSILVSQIPMSYDSAGMKLHFQSDGMFNLSAFDSNNQEVKLKENVDIHYPQTTGRTSSNTYFLENDEWSYIESTPTTTYAEVCENTVYKFQQEPVTPAVNNEFKNVLDNLEHEYQALEDSKPLEPIKNNLENYRFQLDVNPAEFPELTNFDDVIFEVKDSRFSWSIYEETWNDIDVSKGEREGRYLVTLKNTKRVEIFDVYPVLDEEEFALAFSDYGAEMKRIEESKKDVSRKIKENKKREAKFLADLKKQEKHSKTVSKKKRIVNELTADLSSDTPYRSVNLGGLGTINFDIGLPLPAKGMKVPAEFYVAKNSTTVKGVSLINIGDNIYYSFAHQDFPEFRYMRGKNHVLVSVLPDGQIAAYRSDLDSEKIKRGVPYRFSLDISDASNLDELRDFLGLSESI